MVAAVAVVAAVTLGTWRLLDTRADLAVTGEPSVDPGPDVDTGPPSPFAAIDPESVVANEAEREGVAEADTAVVAVDVGSVPSVMDDRPVDLAALGRDPIEDDDFERLATRLTEDSALLSALIDEVRSETDPERLRRLLQLLGAVDDPSVVALATELVYSGDAAMRDLGLELMQRVAPGDEGGGVLATVSSLLSTEVEGAVLVPALTALARPGGVDGDTRASLSGQVALLTDHSDPAVRRTSLDILSRWSDDATYTPQLMAGLGDEDPTVRRAAAFAFVGRGDDSEMVRRALFAMADDGSQDEAPRRGAILALRGMAADDTERARIDAIERRLDTRPLR